MISKVTGRRWGFTAPAVAALATALTLRGLRGTAGPTGFSIRPADGSRA